MGRAPLVHVLLVALDISVGPLHRGSGEGRHLHVHIETTLIVNDSVHYLI